jgi:hypothetical protein
MPVSAAAAREDPHSQSRREAPREGVEAAVLEPTACEFVRTPLNDVASYFAKRHEIAIALDEKALDQAGIETATPVTARVRGVKLQSALNLVLSQVGLTWTADNKGVCITTPEAARRRLVLANYDIRGLGFGPRVDASEVIDVVQATIEPASWSDAGGAGTVERLPQASLIQVRQTYRVHRQIEQLFDDLREARKH